MNNARVPILGFAAFSGTGKTTLLTALIPLLKHRGLQVGVIKHSHHSFEIDKPGKDSYRLRSAGATPVMLASKLRRAVITEFDSPIEPTLEDALAHFDQEAVDLVLVEGFKRESFPKIELHRPTLGKPLLCGDDASIIAVASDEPLPLPEGLPRLDLNSPESVADFILERFFPARSGIDACAPQGHVLMSVEQATESIQAVIQAVSPTEQVDLKNAIGRVLAGDVCAPMDTPPFRNSAMDGYAFHSRDIVPDRPTRLQVMGTAWAGRPYAGRFQQSGCIRVFTGAVVPAEFDSVVMQEEVTRDGESVLLPAHVQPGQHLRLPGEDIRRGDAVIERGKKLTPADISLLASLGLNEVAVRRRPTVAYFSTGDELRTVSEVLRPGEIYDSNRYLLHGLLAREALSVRDMGVLRDDPATLESALTEAAADCDAIITTGGASVGEADHIPELLMRLGSVDLWKIAMKPGKPLIFGRIGRCLVFGLPGNPVSVLTTYEVLVKPALRRLMGAADSPPLRLQARCESDLKKPVGRKEFQRGFLKRGADGTLTVTSAGRQGSHLLGVLAKANCFIILPAESRGASAGTLVEVQPFDIEL